MAAEEYLSFIPLLLYGISLTELMSQWRRIVVRRNIYWPYIVMTIVITEQAIFSIWVYWDNLHILTEIDYKIYLLYILPPIFFLLATMAFTPDKGEKTEEYFNSNIVRFSLLYGLFFISHAVFIIFDTLTNPEDIVVAIVLFLIMAITRKPWIAYLFGIKLIYHMIF